MKDRTFIDTNIWIYLFLQDDSQKHDVVEKLIENCPVILTSVQVLNEIINVLKKKYKIDDKKIEQFLIDIINLTDMVTNLTTKNTFKALQLSQKYSLNFYDSLIISSALASNCSKIYTEDMHHMMVVEKSLKIINPFKSEHSKK